MPLAYKHNLFILLGRDWYLKLDFIIFMQMFNIAIYWQGHSILFVVQKGKFPNFQFRIFVFLFYFTVGKKSLPPQPIFFKNKLTFLVPKMFLCCKFWLLPVCRFMIMSMHNFLQGKMPNCLYLEPKNIFPNTFIAGPIKFRLADLIKEKRFGLLNYAFIIRYLQRNDQIKKITDLNADWFLVFTRKSRFKKNVKLKMNPNLKFIFL